jgi:membrane fusion protein, multidrug efflux system
MPPPGPTGPTGWCKVAFERATELRKSGAIAQQILDDARRTYDVALASLEATRATQVTARREVSVQSAAVSAAGAAVGRAKYDLDRTVIVAPVTI